MKVEFIKKEGNTVNFKIQVDDAQFEASIEKAYKKNKGKYNIPGFRKGKAPRKIIEAQLGKGVFFNDAIDILFREVYPKAIEELALTPIDNPDLDIEEISKDNGIVMIFNVDVKPEVVVENYKGIEVAKIDDTVSDEQVEAELKLMQERNARIISVEDKEIENGDTVVIDYEGFKDGVAFEGGKAENYNLVIGSGHFIPGFEEGLVGKKANEEVELNITFPEQYHSEELAGAPVVFKVTIKDVKVKELSDIDDEFAKDVSEFDTLDELKSDIRANLEEATKVHVREEVKQAVLNKIAESVEIDIPEAMVNRQVENMIEQLDYQMRAQGFSIEQLLQMSGKTIADLVEDRKEDAKKIVKQTLIMEAIVKAENVEVSEEEIDKELEAIAKMYKMEFDDLKKMIVGNELHQIEEEIKFRKTLDLLADNAVLA
ncbi:MAG: trigger factor [Clostridioides sp.]|jgi:trigger factor|nr:trigger factor [Clostridioides sp.]